MAITLVVGPPGSGKTFWTMRRFRLAVLAGRCVATNVVLSDGWADSIARSVWLYRFVPALRRRKVAEWESKVAYVETLDDVARIRLSTEGWESKLEGRGELIWDEAGDSFDARNWNEDKEKRGRDNRWMRQHRKLGWEVFLVAQDEGQIDVQVRNMCTYLVHLVNLKNLRLAWFLPAPPVNLFRAHWKWHGSTDRKPHKLELYKLDKRTARLYDTHQIVQKTGHAEDGVVWLPRGYEPPVFDALDVEEEDDVDQGRALADADPASYEWAGPPRLDPPSEAADWAGSADPLVPAGTASTED